MTFGPAQSRKPGAAAGRRPHRLHAWHPAGLIVASLLAAGCAGPVGPDYVRPAAPAAAHWSDDGWRAAHPSDDQPRGAWWNLYTDPILDRLETQAGSANLDLQAALARVRQSDALVQVARAALSPQVVAGGNAIRTRTSANRPYAIPGTATPTTVQNDFLPALSVRWETDLAGGVRRSVEAARASAEQARADAETTRLVVSSSVAANYLGLRALDADIAQLARLMEEQERAVALTRRRALLGLGTALDITTQQALLEQTRVQLDSERSQRGSLVTALAVLTGTPPPDFHLEDGAPPSKVPRPPVGLPSDLLERRPDIASAERSLAQSNAQIGIATAARYPDLSLGGGFGTESRSLGRLFDLPSLAWNVAANLAAPLYDGGRISANIAAASAAHEANVAHYRETVLTAMGEVEAALAADEALARASEQQEAEWLTAQQQLKLIRQRHDEGFGTALDTVAAEQALTLADRGRTQLLGQRLANSVLLIKALGGTWAAPAHQAAAPREPTASLK